MKAWPQRVAHRRGFLRAVGRGGVLVSLGILAAWQEVKRRRLDNDPDCIRLSPCAACGKFARCTLPRARTARGSPEPQRE